MNISIGTTDSLRMINSLLTFLTRLQIATNSDYTSHLILVYEPKTAATIDQLAARLPSSGYGSVNMYQLPDSTSIHQTNGPSSLLHCFNCLVLAFLYYPQSYINLLAIEPTLAARQTVLLCTNPNGLDQFEATGISESEHSLRLLFLEKKPAPEDSTLLAFVWPIGKPISHQTAHQLTFDELFAQPPEPASHLFWDRVRHISQPITFVADLRPPSHLNACELDVIKCMYFGPYVFLAKLLTSRLTSGLYPEPTIRPVQRDAVVRFREIFGNSTVDLRLSNTTDKWRHLSDAYTEYDRRNEVIEGLSSFADSRHYTFGVRPAYTSGIYSFDVEDVLLVVPYRRKTGCSQHVEKRLAILLMWLLTVTAMATVRSGSEWRPRSFGRLMIETWAQSIGNTGGSNSLLLRRNGAVNAQRLAIVSLSVYAILAGSYFTGAIVQNMIRCDDGKQIEELDDFGRMTNLSFVMPIQKFRRLYEEYKKKSEAILSDMDRRQQWASITQIQASVWSHDINAGYVMERSETEMLHTPQMHYANGEPIFHVVEELVGTRSISLDNVPWYLKNVVNEVIVACVEHGLLDHFRSLSRFAFRTKHQPVSGEKNNSDPMDFSIHWNTLGLGLLFATIGFGLEWLVYLCDGRRGAI